MLHISSEPRASAHPLEPLQSPWRASQLHYDAQPYGGGVYVQQAKKKPRPKGTEAHVVVVR